MVLSLLLLFVLFFSTAVARQAQKEQSQPGQDKPFVDNDALLSSKQPVELLNATLKKGVTKENNFVYVVWEAFGRDYKYSRNKAYFERLGFPADMKSSITFKTWENFQNENKVRPFESKPAECKDRTWVDKWVVQEKASLDFAEKSAALPHYFSPVAIGNRDIHRVFPSAVILSGDLVKGLIARSNMRTRQGNLDGAWESILASFRISRLVSREPSLDGLRRSTTIDKKIHAALLDLSHDGQFSKALAEKCKKDLLTLAPLPTWADKLEQGEKALALHRIGLIESGGPKALLQVLKNQPSIRSGIYRPNLDDVPTEWASDELAKWEQSKQLVVEHYDELASLMRQRPRSKAYDTRRKWNSENLKPFNKLGIWDEKKLNLTEAAKAEDLAKLMLLYCQPDLRKFHDTETQTFDRQQFAPIVLALGAYRATHGDYPKKLEELVPEFIEDVADRLNVDEEKPAAPFRYYKVGNGYSIKSNAKLKNRDGVRVK